MSVAENFFSFCYAGVFINLLKQIPEYQWAYQYNMGPTLFNGSADNKVGKLTLDMTGGTELDKSRVSKLVMQV